MGEIKGLTNSPQVKKGNLEGKLDVYSTNLETYNIIIRRLNNVIEKLRGCQPVEDKDNCENPSNYLNILTHLNEGFNESNMELRDLVSELEELI